MYIAHLQSATVHSRLPVSKLETAVYQEDEKEEEEQQGRTATSFRITPKSSSRQEEHKVALSKAERVAAPHVVSRIAHLTVAEHDDGAVSRSSNTANERTPGAKAALPETQPLVHPHAPLPLPGVQSVLDECQSRLVSHLHHPKAKIPIPPEMILVPRNSWIDVHADRLHHIPDPTQFGTVASDVCNYWSVRILHVYILVHGSYRLISSRDAVDMINDDDKDDATTLSSARIPGTTGNTKTITYASNKSTWFNTKLNNLHGQWFVVDGNSHTTDTALHFQHQLAKTQLLYAHETCVFLRIAVTLPDYSLLASTPPLSPFPPSDTVSSMNAARTITLSSGSSFILSSIIPYLSGSANASSLSQPSSSPPTAGLLLLFRSQPLPLRDWVIKDNDAITSTSNHPAELYTAYGYMMLRYMEMAKQIDNARMGTSIEPMHSLRNGSYRDKWISILHHHSKRALRVVLQESQPIAAGFWDKEWWIHQWSSKPFVKQAGGRNVASVLYHTTMVTADIHHNASATTHHHHHHHQTNYIYYVTGTSSPMPIATCLVRPDHLHSNNEYNMFANCRAAAPPAPSSSSPLVSLSAHHMTSLSASSWLGVYEAVVGIPRISKWHASQSPSSNHDMTSGAIRSPWSLPHTALGDAAQPVTISLVAFEMRDMAEILRLHGTGCKSWRDCWWKQLYMFPVVPLDIFAHYQPELWDLWISWCLSNQHTSDDDRRRSGGGAEHDDVVYPVVCTHAKVAAIQVALIAKASRHKQLHLYAKMCSSSPSATSIADSHTRAMSPHHVIAGTFPWSAHLWKLFDLVLAIQDYRTTFIESGTHCASARMEHCASSIVETYQLYPASLSLHSLYTGVIAADDLEYVGQLYTSYQRHGHPFMITPYTFDAIQMGILQRVFDPCIGPLFQHSIEYTEWLHHRFTSILSIG